MKNCGLLFLIGFAAFTASWGGFVLAPQLQSGRETLAPVTGGTTLYPQPRPGLAVRGAEVYRANGCYHCHTRQVQQEGTTADVVLTEAGTNQAGVLEVFKQMGISLADTPLSGLPRDLMTDVDKADAQVVHQRLTDAGAKASVIIRARGADIDRGWGMRGSVSRDYLQDQPLLLGAQRLGPDLANIGVRKPDLQWHLRHLYSPTSVVEGSTMPPYRYLFEKRRVYQAPSPEALVLEGDQAPEAGFEIVPTEDARALAAFLVSLNSDVPLFEAPFTAPQAPEAEQPAVESDNIATVAE